MTPKPVPSIDSVICQEVTSLGFCTLEELTQRLQADSWVQVFAAVDRLSRQGTLKLTRTGRFGYAVSVGSAPPRLKLLQGRSRQAPLRGGRRGVRAVESRGFMKGEGETRTR